MYASLCCIQDPLNFQLPMPSNNYAQVSANEWELSSHINFEHNSDSISHPIKQLFFITSSAN